MRRRRLIAIWLTTVLAMLGIVILGAAFLFRPAPRVTEENFVKIKGGMTRPEVESLLGPPYKQRVFVSPSASDASANNARLTLALYEEESVWNQPTISISIVYNEKREVVSASFTRVLPQNLWNRLLKKLTVTRGEE